jgi:hypothetical protein
MGLYHRVGTSIAVGMLLLSVAHAEEERRELGPHVHGHGTFALAIEANNVQMELVAPGMDIVGFEHEAETARQKKAVKAALADLKDPLKLFVLPEATGCTVTSVDVKLIGEEREDHQADLDADRIAETDEHEGGHSEFRGTYALACADASLIRFIHFAFFERFRDSEELEVTIIGPNGETRAEVSRGAPSLED